MAAEALNNLPDEILLQIVCFIDRHRSQRILGYIPDDPPPSSPDEHLISDFLMCNKSLCSLALTSRRFHAIAQEFLFSAPIIGGCIFCVRVDRKTPRIVLLLRTLYDRPDLRRHIKHIRIRFPEEHAFLEGRNIYSICKRLAKHELERQTPCANSADVIRLSHELVASLGLPDALSMAWKVQLFGRIMYGVMGILLALLPKLEHLSLSDQNSTTTNEGVWPSHYITGTWPTDFGNGWSYEVDPCLVQSLPAATSLKTLKVSSKFALCFGDLEMFPNLDTLDLALKLAGGDAERVRDFERVFSQPVTASTASNFDRIRHLRLVCQTKTAGIWDFAACISMAHILRAFRNLISLDFYAEPSNEKNPYRSVRAFPSSQRNIQTYPDEPDQDDTTWSPFLDQRIYDARTQYTNYQAMVDSLVHIRPRLETLKLPGGSWTLPGAMPKPLPSFLKFSALRRLVVPQAAILSIELDNMLHSETIHRDFDLLLTAVLPPTLQYLKIFDADADLLASYWLMNLFVKQKKNNNWPELRTVEVLFGPNMEARELGEDLQDWRNWGHIKALADKSSFRFLVGWDDEVPSIRA